MYSIVADGLPSSSNYINSPVLLAPSINRKLLALFPNTTSRAITLQHFGRGHLHTVTQTLPDKIKSQTRGENSRTPNVQKRVKLSTLYVFRLIKSAQMQMQCHFVCSPLECCSVFTIPVRLSSDGIPTHQPSPVSINPVRLCPI